MKYPEISKRFRMILLQRKISAQELSEKSGVGKSAISHYVNGSHEPHNINASKLADVLDVNPMWLMGFDVPMEMDLLERIQTPKNMVITNSTNHEFVNWMNELSKDLTLDKQKAIITFAEFMKEKKDDE